MTLFPLRQLWRLLATIAAAAPLALIPALAFGDVVPPAPEGTTVSSDIGSDVTYTFIESPGSGPVKIDLNNSNISISAEFDVYSDATIFTINGSGKTATLTGNDITIHTVDGIKKSLTFGSPSEATDLGTIIVNDGISGGESLTINRGSKDAKTIFSGDNSGFFGTVNIDKGQLIINNANAISDSNAVVISENGTLVLNTGATVEMIKNEGTINLGNSTLVIEKIGSTLGNVSAENGQLQFNSADFTLDDSGTLNNVDLVLNGTTKMSVNNGIKSAGNTKISTSDSGKVELNNATKIVGAGTLTIDDINLNSKALSIESNSSNLYTVKFTNFSEPGNITIKSNTVLQLGTDLVTNSDLHGYKGGTLQGNLIQSGSGKTYVESGTFTINGDAKYYSDSGIVMVMDEGIPSLNVDGNLIFNTNSTTAVTSDNAQLTTLTLSGNNSGDPLSIKAKNIYGYGDGSSSESELNNNLGFKGTSTDDGMEYIVYNKDSESTENYFKILLKDDAFEIGDVKYNNGVLDIDFTRSTTDNPIEQIIVKAAKGNDDMADLDNKINHADCGRDAALNQLNPYTVSATTANQMWISQEYVSRTFQRMKMVRMAACGYDNFVPVGYPGFANVDDPETAYLGQSYGYPEYGYGYDYGYGYGAPCGWRPGSCGVLGNQWWFRGIGAWERQEADGPLARYDTDYSGFTIGVDRLYAPGVLFGMSAGGVWNTTKFRDPGGSVAKGGTFLLDLYGSYFNNCGHFDYMFGYQSGSTDTTRRTDFGVDPTYGKIKSNTFIAAIELGRTFRFLRNSLEPYYDLQYINIQNDGLREHGDASVEYGDEAALVIEKNNQHALLQTIGLRYMGSCAGPLKGYYFVPQVEVGWVHNYSNTDIISVASFANAVEAGSFVTSGYHVPRDRVKVAVGLDIVFGPTAKIDIKYECQAGSGFGFHTLTGGFDWNF